jgi:hypothetical protein
MPLTLPLLGSQNDPLSAGTYEIKFVTPFPDTLSGSIDAIPKDITIESHRIHINSIVTRRSGSWALPDTVIVNFTLLDNPIPALAIVAGLVLLLGLTAIAITSWSISKVIDNPAALPAVYWFLILATVGVFLLWKGTRKLLT